MSEGEVNLRAVTHRCTIGDNFSNARPFKSRLRKKITWSKDYQEMVRVVLEVFDAYPAESLDGIWGCLYNNYRSVLESDGGNQYKIAHNNGRKRARETGSSVDLELSRDLYNKVRRALRL